MREASPHHSYPPPGTDGQTLYAPRIFPPCIWIFPPTTTRKFQAWASREEGNWETPKFPEREGSSCIKPPQRALLYCEAGEQPCKMLGPEKEENTPSSSGSTTSSQDLRQEEADPAETCSLGDWLSFREARPDLRCISPFTFTSYRTSQGSRNIPWGWIDSVMAVAVSSHGGQISGVPSSPKSMWVPWPMFCPEMEWKPSKGSWMYFPKVAAGTKWGLHGGGVPGLILTMITRITAERSLHARGSVKGFVQMIVLVLTPLVK